MKKRMGMIMWLCGMIGVLSILPFIYSLHITRASAHSNLIVLVAQTLQSGIILALAVWGGVVFSSKVNLKAPCFEAMAKKHLITDKLRPQLLPGIISGVGVGVFLIVINYFRPIELMTNMPNVQATYRILSEILYGGITEEMLLRWGWMTFVLWMLWRFVQRNQSVPSQLLVWIAIITSALLFALGHLPAAYVLVGHLTFYLTSYIIIANAIAGVVFGFLYQRYGLESAMIAHASAHLVKELLTLMV